MTIEERSTSKEKFKAQEDERKQKTVRVGYIRKVKSQKQMNNGKGGAGKLSLSFQSKLNQQNVWQQPSWAFVQRKLLADSSSLTERKNGKIQSGSLSQMPPFASIAIDSFPKSIPETNIVFRA